MKALTWHGRHDVRIDEVRDPRIEAPTDAIVRITSTGICGSDLHLYEVLGMFLDAGFPKDRPTNGTSICRTCFRPRGRRSPMPTSPKAAPRR